MGEFSSILQDHELTNSRQQLEATAREERAQCYGKQKNASHALSEADEEFLWPKCFVLLYH